MGEGLLCASCRTSERGQELPETCHSFSLGGIDTERPKSAMESVALNIPIAAVRTLLARAASGGNGIGGSANTSAMPKFVRPGQMTEVRPSP